MKNKLRSILWLTAVCMFVVWAIFGHQYRVTYNHGQSMEPTYQDGEWIIAEKRSSLSKDWTPDKYDTIIIRDESHKENLCKRVIGLPGDTVEIIEGAIYLNGRELDDPFGEGEISFFLVDENDNNLLYWNGPEIGKPVIKLVNQGAEKVPEKHVWVIGDNRSASWYGLLPIKDIKGLVIF